MGLFETLSFGITPELREKQLAKFLSKFLDEFEGAFDVTDHCESIEIAEDYLQAAEFMHDHYGRGVGRIREVQEWIDNQ